MSGTLVQGKFNRSGSASTAITVNASNGLATITGGNLIIAIVSYAHSSGGKTVTFTDQSSNTLSFASVQAELYDGPSEVGFHVFILPNCPSGITGITATLSSSATFGEMVVIEEWSGLATTGQPDGINQSKATATLATDNISSGAASNANQPAIVWAMTADLNHANLPTNGTGYTAGTSFPNVFNATNSSRTEWKRVTATGSNTATFTNTGTSGDLFSTQLAILDEQPPILQVGIPLPNPGPGVSPNLQQQFTPQLSAHNFSPVLQLTGVTGTGGVGNVTAPNNVVLTGVSATGTAGTVVATPQIPLTQDGATGSVGSVIPSLTINLLGIATPGTAGFVTPSGGTPVPNPQGLLSIPGNPALSSPYNLNQFKIWNVSYDLPANTSGTAALTGVTGTGGVGTVGTQNSGGTATLTGVGATGSVGSVVPSTSIGVLGIGSVSGLGIVPPYSTISITGGVSGTGSVGNVFPPATAPLFGVSAVGSVGTLIFSPGVGFAMPNVVGLNYYMAILALQKVGIYNPQSVLNFNQTSISVAWAVSKSAPGIVIAQSVSQGTKIPAGTPLTLTVAEFPFGSVIDSPPDWRQRTN